MSDTNNKQTNVNENTPQNQEGSGDQRAIRNAKPNNKAGGYNNRNNRTNQGNRSRKPDFNNRYNKGLANTAKEQNSDPKQAQTPNQTQPQSQSQNQQNQNQSKQGNKKQEFYNKQSRPRGQKGGKVYVKYNRQVMPGETVEDIAEDITRIEKELVIEIEEISHVAL